MYFRLDRTCQSEISLETKLESADFVFIDSEDGFPPRGSVFHAEFSGVWRAIGAVHSANLRRDASRHVVAVTPLAVTTRMIGPTVVVIRPVVHDAMASLIDWLVGSFVRSFIDLLIRWLIFPLVGLLID